MPCSPRYTSRLLIRKISVIGLVGLSHVSAVFSQGQIEEVFGICDPNPTEFVESYGKQPNIVVYRGLQLRTINVSEIESVETDFLKNLNSGSFRGPVGRIQLWIVQASQLPKTGECGDGNNKMTRACWRIREDKQCKNTPVYSRHLPRYVVGYEKMNNNNREAESMEVES